MSRPRQYHWWACWHGMPFDARWLVVARNAGVTPGHVCAVWTALLDHASQARPRGSVEGFDVASVAAFFQWTEAEVGGVVEALEAAGRIVDGKIGRWPARQLRDPSGADRQARRRARLKEVETAAASEPRGDSVTSRDNHENHRDSNAYSTLHKSKSLQPCSSPQDPISPASLDASRASIGELWECLESQGVPVGMIARMRNATILGGWSRQGVTVPQLLAAVDRARRARRAQGDASPLNVPYVAKFLEALLAGRPDRSAPGFSAADAAADEYLARSAR